MTTFKRDGLVDEGDVMTTQLNSLGNGLFSGVGLEFDNSPSGKRYLYALLEVNLASLDPTPGAYIAMYLVHAVDGSNYEDAPSATQDGIHQIIPPGPLSVETSSSAKLICVPMFDLPATKVKFVLFNGTGVALASSGNTVRLFGGYDAGV